MYNAIHTVEAAEALGAVTLPEAVVYQIDTDENNRVTAMHYYDAQHVLHKVTAKAFVIACNALETPRVLLAANDLNAEIRRRATHGVDLSISLEPLPDPANRVTLSKTRMDPHGIPYPYVYCDIGDYVRTGYEKSVENLRGIADLFGATDFVATTSHNANNHIMGGTIMGANPADSVTNGDCGAHDHDNLWLPGG